MRGLPALCPGSFDGEGGGAFRGMMDNKLRDHLSGYCKASISIVSHPNIRCSLPFYFTCKQSSSQQSGTRSARCKASS